MNDRNPSSNGFKLRREFTGICKQKWCLAHRANVPKTWTFFVFWFNFPLNWGHLPQPLSMQQLPKSVRLISSISKESLSLAVPLHAQELSVTGSWLSPVSILEPIMVATKMQASDWSGRSHMTPPGGGLVWKRFPEGKSAHYCPDKG